MCAKRKALKEFCRIQNLHISQTKSVSDVSDVSFCRIQNLHISQTVCKSRKNGKGFVEFKIYISLKRSSYFLEAFFCFVEFKIYISLKPQIEI